MYNDIQQENINNLNLNLAKKAYSPHTLAPPEAAYTARKNLQNEAEKRTSAIYIANIPNSFTQKVKHWR